MQIIKALTQKKKIVCNSTRDIIDVFIVPTARLGKGRVVLSFIHPKSIKELVELGFDVLQDKNYKIIWDEDKKSF